MGYRKVGVGNLKTYKDITKLEKEILDSGLFIENNIIRSIDLSIIGHFGNITTLEVICDNCCMFSQYNIGTLIPDVLKTLIETLELSKEDVTRMSEIKNVPIRIITTQNHFGTVVGFGHFMKNRFLLIEDIIQMAKNNIEQKYR